MMSGSRPELLQLEFQIGLSLLYVPQRSRMGPLESPDEGSDILLEAGAGRLYGKRERQKCQGLRWDARAAGHAGAAPAVVPPAGTRTDAGPLVCSRPQPAPGPRPGPRR